MVIFAIALCSVALVAATPRVSTNTIVRLHLVFSLVLEILGAFVLIEHWHLLCVFAASTITASVFGQRDLTSLLIGIAGASILSAIGLLHGVENWLVFSIILVLIGPVARSTSQILDVLKDNEAEALSELSSSMDAVLWEQEFETTKMRTVAGSSQTLTAVSYTHLTLPTIYSV